ncbi:MAG: hypothetical protein CMO81_09645 [Waddliaceae bacterium]|nr:hypothetical protein [Waddliaceae bacterium]
MNVTTAFARTFFTLLSILFMSTYTISILGEMSALSLTVGLGLGILTSFFLLGVEYAFRRFSIRALNTITIGLFAGYLLGTASTSVLEAVLSFAPNTTDPQLLSTVKTIVFLLSTYLAITLTIRASEEFYISLPFVRFKTSGNNKRDLILDSSALSDPRLIDLATSGLVDRLLVIPRFILNTLYAQVEHSDEGIRNRARRGLEVIKKLEAMPDLNVRFNETDFPEISEHTGKLVKLARLTNANLITAEMNQVETSAVEGVKIININRLSNALKPLTQSGESITIKIQRYGKEARQGVGYLDDGTMVVVNGGGDYIGETIKAQVLSVKHTSSGRMIFCNTRESAAAAGQIPAAEQTATRSTSRSEYTGVSR